MLKVDLYILQNIQEKKPGKLKRNTRETLEKLYNKIKVTLVGGIRVYLLVLYTLIYNLFCNIFELE